MTEHRNTDLPEYGRRFFDATETFTRIGAGAIGGKAAGLLLIRNEIIPKLDAGAFPSVEIVVPTLTVLTTELYDSFVGRNRIDPPALAELPDHRIAHALQQADMPAEFVGDLWGIADRVRAPLAVRSSSLLEDSLQHPFAGVYATKMTPNDQPDVESRFRRLVEAIKFVYASTHFRTARDYLRSLTRKDLVEKMAVIVQEVVGSRWGDRYYPHVSGVARSFNYYPAGHGRPEDGVANLALGLGKQIVDGGISWSYAPPYPRAPAPFADTGDMIRNTQSRFWAVHMGRPLMPDPCRETEYLVEHDLSAAEADGTIARIASTYDAGGDRIRPGIGTRGPRVLNFAPILQSEDPPLNDLIRQVLSVAERTVGGAVEFEFALTLPGPGRVKTRFGILQVRPMAVAEGVVELDEDDLRVPGTLLASEQALGNGVRDDIEDVVYLKPEQFDTARTPVIAGELETVNRSLLDAGRPYLLIGFGRWGSSDSWLGVPVEWGQISGARVIVEATLPDVNTDMSQGSHFFHNMIGFGVFYLAVRHGGSHRIDWDRLNSLPAVFETDHVRHVRLDRPLHIEVDGRSSRGRVGYADEQE